VAKTTKKTASAKRTSRTKSSSAKESPRKVKKSAARSSNKKTTRAVVGAQTQKVVAKKTAGETEVTIDRRRSDRRTNMEPVATDSHKLERREKVTRRRQIDPTTCERDYSDDEVEFMSALDNYTRTSGRMFPTCSEILEVIRRLGYAKRTAMQGGSPEPSSEVDEEINAMARPVSADEHADDSVDDEVIVGEELLV
jgi:hypothetical protein